ncbi:sensor histidine kinase [uncultured Oxalicibacterium sp.]|uniref:sensor histidine kinase n=1 Tax=uncultured Oxalicibacterium sp. TaxID=1168540 RepID=UPI0025E8D1CA|nr:sensor histidine kinase [uncultured Oxalicibacterium sp.]
MMRFPTLCKSIALLLLLYLTAMVHGFAHAVTIVDQPKLDLRGQLAQLVDRSHAMTLADIRAADATFAPVADQVQRDAVDAAVWIRFSLRGTRTDPHAYWLEVEPAILEHVTLYSLQPDGNVTQHAAGSLLPFSQRGITYRHAIFQLDLPAGETRQYYLRVDSGMWRTARLTVWEPMAFLAASGTEQLGFGLYIGMYALLVLASLWFERVMRDKVYLCFALYVTACIFITLISTGLWQQYVMPESGRVIVQFYALSFVMMIGAAVQFFVVFVGLHRTRPRLTRHGLLGIWALCAVTMCASLAGYHRYALYFFNLTVIFVILPLGVLFLSGPAMRSENEIRLTFVGGGFLLVMSYLYSAASSYHVLAPNWLTNNIMYISSMTFFLIVFYAISRRYYTMRLAQETAQREMLRLSHRSERELEKLVDERTRALKEAKQSAESALNHAHAVQQEQRHFIATVSHELRTPLAVIDASAQNLQRDAAVASDKHQLRVQKIRQATKRLSSLFNDYLSDERFAQLSQPMVPQEVAVAPLFADTIEAAFTLSDHHTLQMQVAPDLHLWADPYGLRLTLRTLVDNAVKYSPPGSTVLLSAQADIDGWTIDVHDDGLAIAEDERVLIFERYYRGRASASRVGTGLGLALARRFAEQHGGTLQLLCPPSGGNVFRLTLPRVQNIDG